MKQCILCGKIGETLEERVAHFDRFHKKQIEDMPEINRNMSCREIQRIWRGKYG